MAQAVINPGACGHSVVLTAQSDDMQTVKVGVETSCKKIENAVGSLGDIDAYGVYGAGRQSEIEKAFVETCPGCIVADAASKTVQIAAGLQLPKPVSIEFDS